MISNASCKMQQREKAKAAGRGEKAGIETVGKGIEAAGVERHRGTGRADSMAGRQSSQSQRVVCGLDKAPATA